MTNFTECPVLSNDDFPAFLRDGLVNLAATFQIVGRLRGAVEQLGQPFQAVHEPPLLFFLYHRCGDGLCQEGTQFTHSQVDDARVVGDV